MGKWLTRRAFITTGIASVAAVGLTGGVSVLSCGSDDDTLVTLDRLDEALWDIQFAGRISAAVRKERAETDLLTELGAHKALHAALQTSCPQTRRAMIGEICRQEFRDGEYLVVDRLVVSRTECLISALRA